MTRFTKDLRYRFRQADWKAQDRLRGKAGYYTPTRRRRSWGRWKAEVVIIAFLLVAVLAAVSRPEIRHLVWWQ